MPLTIGPLGHLVLLWQEMSTNGSDAHYVVYDPVADTWSKDDLLCQDPPLERSFAPVWDNVGNLTVAYDKVQILYTNKTVTWKAAARSRSRTCRSRAGWTWW